MYIGAYGSTKNYTNGTYFLKEINDYTKNVIKYEDSFSTATSTTPIKMTQTYYSANLNNYITDTDILELLIKKTNNSYKYYWLNSQCVHVSNNSYCDYRIHLVQNTGLVDAFRLFNSLQDTEYTASRAICPIVTLNKDVNLVWDDANNVWNIK
ncbi:MAG: hypothetical protein IJJ82_03100 [Clostridia bacterium]|nr:hypothetical protein [Clostridia bacterium]